MPVFPRKTLETKRESERIMKRVTIREVAALAGVSSATVSRALNNHPAISEETKCSVREACRALNYVPDITARGLSGHKTHTIGVIVPDISNPYFAGICTAVERRAAELGYRVLLTNTLYDPAHELDAIERMLSQRVDGLLISACTPHSQEGHAPLLRSVPCIYLGSNHGTACSYVEVDNERGAYKAVQYLWHLGHREIAFIGGRAGSRGLELRLDGYRRSMLQNGLLIQEFVGPEDDSLQQSWCYDQARNLFGRGAIPGAIIAFSDILAMQILNAAEQFGLRAPDDFSIIGFDDISFSRLPQISLTTVSLRLPEMGRLAAERLLEKVNGDDRLTADVVQPELMIRSTCRRV